MHAMQPDLERLMRFATRERLLPPGEDLGYAFHVALAASFAERAPKPFVWCAPGTRSGGRSGRLLCYSSEPLDELVAHAEAFAEPTALALLGLTSAESKTMPLDFAPGTRVGFRVRIRPVLRTGKTRDGSGGKERDAYFDDAPVEARSTTRAECYLHWLSHHIQDGGAHLDQARLDSFSLTRLMTRDRSGEKSRRNSPTGPDAVAIGTATVSDPEKFTVMLGRGVGRFRSFGFGMLLLSPPRATGS